MPPIRVPCLRFMLNARLCARYKFLYYYYYYKVTQWRYWQGNGLVIYRSRVQVLAGYHCVVASVSNLHLSASVTKQYNLVLAKAVISLAGIVTAALMESNSSLAPGL